MKDDATTVKPMIFAIRTELVSRLYACFSDDSEKWLFGMGSPHNKCKMEIPHEMIERHNKK